jgi:hypothetical protein
MARVVSMSDIEELDQSDQDPRAVARTLVDWTEEEGVRYESGLSPAELLSQAATRFGRAGDETAQWDVLQRALRADGEPLFDIRAKMIANLLERGETEQASEHARQLRRDGVRSPYAILLLAESYTKAGQPQQAMRWHNIGIRQAERENWSEGQVDHEAILLQERYRFRRDQGYPMDGYDEEAETVTADQLSEET